MANIKIFLKKSETPDSVKEALKKALEAFSPENSHKESFHDPAAQDVLEKLEYLHQKTTERILDEVDQIIRR